MLKKFKSTCLDEIYTISNKNNSTLLKLSSNPDSYSTQRINLLNNFVRLITKSETLLEIKVSKIKKDLKQSLLKIQNDYNTI